MAGDADNNRQMGYSGKDPEAEPGNHAHFIKRSLIHSSKASDLGANRP